MTEDEAKTKWCCGPPMNVMAAGVASGRRELGPDDGHCIASACMAWRVIDPHLAKARRAAAAGQKIEAIKHLRDDDPNLDLKTAKARVEAWDFGTDRGGFCGLAGTPQ